MLHNTSRAPPGSLSGGRSTIAEKSQRSRGIMWLAMGHLVHLWRSPDGAKRNPGPAERPATMATISSISPHRGARPVGYERGEGGADLVPESRSGRQVVAEHRADAEQAGRHGGRIAPRLR